MNAQTSHTLRMQGDDKYKDQHYDLAEEYYRKAKEKENDLDTQVVPYDEDPGVHDVAISLDVIEHTGNHLGYLRWISRLAKRVMICFPLMGFAPPFEVVIDEWVDAEAVRWVLEKRYKVVSDYCIDSRQFFVWDV